MIYLLTISCFTRKSVKMSTVLIYQLKCNERDKMQKECDYIVNMSNFDNKIFLWTNSLKNTQSKVILNSHNRASVS